MCYWSLVTAGETVAAPGHLGGWGVCTGTRSGVFVVDLDTPEACDAFLAMGPIPETYTVRTGRGAHLYFTLPSFPVRTGSDVLGKNIDIRGDGGFAALPGSPHKDGGLYEVACDAAPAAAPDWLLAHPGLRKVERVQGGDCKEAVDLGTPEGVRRLALGIEYAKTCVKRGEVPSATFQVAMHLTRRLELPFDAAHDILCTHWNPRNDSPRTADELWRKVIESREKGSLPLGIAPESFDATLAALAARPEVARAPTGVRKVADNCPHEYKFTPGDISNAEKFKVTLADVLSVLVRHPDWEGVLQWDDFKRRVYAVRPPVKLDAEGVGGFSREDSVAIAAWFETETGALVGKMTVEDAVPAAARRLRYHPILEWLRGLAPATGRLDEVARVALGDASPMAAKFVRKTLIGAVRRILRPGAQLDTVLILHGNQGAKKSSFVSALFGEPFTRCQLQDISTKDASQALQGYWAVELAELDRLLRVDRTTVKEFITRRFDDFRPPYGLADMRFPRQCVFVGTTNEDDFLTDATGDRRFWPVRVPKGRVIDLDWVRANRDAIWSEAYAAALAGETHYLDDEEETGAEDSRDKYQQVDPWTYIVEDYISGKAHVKSEKIYTDAIARGDASATAKMGQREQRRVTDILKRLGCEPVVKRVDGKLERGYSVPEKFQKNNPSENERVRREADALAKKAGALRVIK